MAEVSGDGEITPIEPPSTATVSTQQNIDANILISESTRELAEQLASGFEAIGRMADKIGNVQDGINDDRPIVKETIQSLTKRVKLLVVAVIFLVVLIATGGPILYVQEHAIHKTQVGNASLLQFVADSQNPNSALSKKNAAITAVELCTLENTIITNLGQPAIKCTAP